VLQHCRCSRRTEWISSSTITGASWADKRAGQQSREVDQINHTLKGLPARVRTSVVPSVTSRLFYELLGKLRLGCLVVSLFRTARQFLRLLELRLKPIPATAWSLITFLYCFQHPERSSLFPLNRGTRNPGRRPRLFAPERNWTLF
jgi:hypothetical protein